MKPTPAQVEAVAKAVHDEHLKFNANCLEHSWADLPDRRRQSYIHAIETAITAWEHLRPKSRGRKGKES